MTSPDVVTTATTNTHRHPEAIVNQAQASEVPAMDSTAILAIAAFIIMFGLFVVVPTLVKRKHADVDVEME